MKIEKSNRQDGSYPVLLLFSRYKNLETMKPKSRKKTEEQQKAVFLNTLKPKLV
jgi:hypothetical protein